MEIVVHEVRDDGSIIVSMTGDSRWRSGSDGALFLEEESADSGLRLIWRTQYGGRHSIFAEREKGAPLEWKAIEPRDDAR